MKTPPCLITHNSYLITHNSYLTDLPIWRVETDVFGAISTDNLMVLELRNREKVEWCGIDLNTQKTLWQGTLPDTNWWTSSIGCYNSLLLLHQYQNNEQPAPKGLLAIDAQTGRTIWQLNNCAFAKTDGQFLQTLRPNAAGEQIKEWWILETSEQLPNEPTFAEAQTAAWALPVAYTENNFHYSFLRDFIEQQTGQKAVKTINYAEIEGCVVLFYYFYDTISDTLPRSLLVINSMKKVIWHEISSSSSDSAFSGQFLYTQNQMVFLRSAQELLVLNFSKS